jgi:membrane associated rhomboid family serine protease
MFAQLPPATRAIIILNVLVFLLQMVAGNLLTELFALWPIGTLFQPWQLITYAFLHGNFAHLFFNMFALFMFGAPLENYWGSRRFTVYYLVCVLTAAATQLAVEAATGAVYQTVGASGGIFGLLLAFGMLFPNERILLYFAIPVPAWLFVTGYGVLELVLGVTGTQAGVAHFAHLGGMLGGAVMMLLWRTRRTRRSPRRF